MALRSIPNNPFLIDLFPPFRKKMIAEYGTTAEILAIILFLAIAVNALSFREPTSSILIGLIVFVWFSHRLEI
tara:strand:- start:2702 stop:2920 length:219 start_codon:yes stop_codon:yes gene_type:complete